MSGRDSSGKRDSSGPVVPWIVGLLDEVRKQGGECLHLKVGTPPRVRMADGLKPMQGARIAKKDSEAAVAKLLNPSQFDRLESSNVLEGSLANDVLGRLRFRIFRQRGSYEILLWPVSAQSPTFSSLKLPLALGCLELLRSGIVLVAAPAGHGKSSTIAAMVDFLNRRQSYHILCVEDPIEYVHGSARSLIDQIEVGRDVPSQAKGLCDAMRMDVDVVVTEAPEDGESVESLLRLAEAGHRVIVSTAAPNLAAAIDGFVERAASSKTAFRERFARQLRLLLVQFLVPRLDGNGQVLVADLYQREAWLERMIVEPESAEKWQYSHEKRDSTIDEQLIRLARMDTIRWSDALYYADDRTQVERAMLLA